VPYDHAKAADSARAAAECETGTLPHRQREARLTAKTQRAPEGFPSGARRSMDLVRYFRFRIRRLSTNFPSTKIWTKYVPEAASLVVPLMLPFQYA